MSKVFYILFVLMFFLPFQLFSQDYAVDKGSFILGGSAGFLSQGGDLTGDERVTTITLNPSIHFFVVPNFAIGADIVFLNVSVAGESGSIFSIGPSLGYFFGHKNSSAYPFLRGSFIFQSVSDSYTETDFKFGGGVVAMVAKNVGIVTEGFYMIQSLKPEGFDESISGNTFGVQMGIAAFIF